VNYKQEQCISLFFRLGFFSKIYAHYRHELTFSGDFQGQERVGCALCNPNDSKTCEQYYQIWVSKLSFMKVT